MHRPALGEPEPRGQDGAHGVVEGAEIALTQEARQMQHALGQDGRFVQGDVDGFETGLVALLQGKDHALGAAVAGPEGQAHPHAGTHVHSLRDAIAVGLVDGIDCRCHSDPGDQVTASSRRFI